MAKISTAANKDVLRNFTAESVDPIIYYSGKYLAKFADLCLTTEFILADHNLAGKCLTNLKTAYAVFLNAKNPNKLVYDYTWRGLVSDAGYKTGDPNADFGNTYYNDHHFHYGYFVRTAAVIARLDGKGLPGNLPAGTWLTKNKEWVNTLVRDVANPSATDPFFPVSRNFDWWHGHSWASGLFARTDGKDEESSSEDINWAYAMNLWGYVTGDTAMESRGALMLAVLNRAINTYMLISHPPIVGAPHPLNPHPEDVHPELFNRNLVSGIIFQNKVDHSTYFGNLPQYIQGIHMLPFTAATVITRTVAFVQAEWNLYFSGKTGGINDGWKGVLYMNVAIAKPTDSWALFSQSGFQDKWLDGGMTRTWALSFAALLGGAA